MKCENCGTTKMRHGRCCASEITRLRNRLSTQSKAMDKLEDEINRLVKRAMNKAPEVLLDPWS